jgi:hypothetical protein
MHPNFKIRGLDEDIMLFKWLGLKTAVGMAFHSDKSKPELIMTTLLNDISLLTSKQCHELLSLLT